MSGASGMLGGGVQQDTDLGARVGDIAVAAPVDEGLALGGEGQPGEASHGGGFAGAIGTEETGDASRLDSETDVVNGEDVAIPFGEVSEGDHGFSQSGTAGPAPRVKVWCCGD